MNINEAFEFINKTASKGSILGLDRIRESLGLLGNPQDDLKFIHIGGTNGKGSVSAYLSYILKESGLKVGLFTSPYIEEYNERIQIDNKNIRDEDLAQTVAEIKPVIERAEELPTEFELNTIIALVYFKKMKCDIVILEVGLGGEFDSTNIVDNKELVILTSIGFDHMKELGNTIEEITTTKSKIIKDDNDVVLYSQDEIVTDIVRQRCAETGSRLYISEPEKISVVSVDMDGQKLEIDGFGTIDINFAAGYQINNAALAFKAIEVLKNKGYKISDYDIKNGFKSTFWPGRFEKINDDPLFIVDGSHNLPGMTATVDSIQRIFKDTRFITIMGVLKDKEYDQMLNKLLNISDRFIAVTPDNPRALDAVRLAEIVEDKGVKALDFKELDEAIDYAFKLSDKSGLPICAIGSLYLVGDVKKIVRNMKAD